MRCSIDWRPLFALSVLLAGLAGCSKAPALAPKTPVRLYFTCDTDGRLEPCGCFTGQHGGLSRLASWLKEQPGPPPLLVDVGDAISGPNDYQIIQYRHLQRACAMMSYVALNMGRREVALSAESLHQLAASPPVPMISANTFDEKTGALIFPPSRIVKYQGRRVAFVGVVEPPSESEPLGAGVRIGEMKTALATLLPTLKGQADLLVLLAFTDEAGMASLARDFYEFDIILGGRVRQPSQKLEIINRSVVVATTNESKALGFVRGTLGAPSVFSEPAYDIIFMDQKIPQNPKVLDLARAYRDEVRRARLVIDDPAQVSSDAIPGVRPTATYVGSQSCRTCHEADYAIWEKSAHAHAFASLERRESEADPNCIACHTVGFGTASGYRREFAGKKFAGVGCESCHGPASEHVREMALGGQPHFKFRPLGPTDCTTCHHGEFSRPFVWEEFWPHVRHGQTKGNRNAIPTASNP